MSAETPVPEDTTLIGAWKQLQASHDFAISLEWAQNIVIPADGKITHPNLMGSMWSIFKAGWDAGLTAAAEIEK